MTLEVAKPCALLRRTPRTSDSGSPSSERSDASGTASADMALSGCMSNRRCASVAGPSMLDRPVKASSNCVRRGCASTLPEEAWNVSRTDFEDVWLDPKS